MKEFDLDAHSLWTFCQTELIGSDKNYVVGIPMNKAKTAKFVEDDVLAVIFAKDTDAILVSIKENLTQIESKLFELTGKSYRIKIVIDAECDDEKTVVRNLKEVFGESDLKIVK
ncbi:MAG: hypothetical protein RR033_00110 [Clostridia bacterium]